MNRQEGRRRAARYVAARRGALDLTQEGLASKARVDPKTVWNLESAERWPQAATRSKLEAALGWAEGDIQKVADGGTPATGAEPSAEGDAQVGGPPDAEPVGQVIDLPPRVRAELRGREVIDYKIVDLTRPGSDHRLVVLWAGELPDDLDETREQLEEWTRRMRAVERVLDTEDEPDNDGE